MVDHAVGNGMREVSDLSSGLVGRTLKMLAVRVEVVLRSRQIDDRPNSCVDKQAPSRRPSPASARPDTRRPAGVPVPPTTHDRIIDPLVRVAEHPPPTRVSSRCSTIQPATVRPLRAAWPRRPPPNTKRPNASHSERRPLPFATGSAEQNACETNRGGPSRTSVTCTPLCRPIASCPRNSSLNASSPSASRRLIASRP